MVRQHCGRESVPSPHFACGCSRLRKGGEGVALRHRNKDCSSTIHLALLQQCEGREQLCVAVVVWIITAHATTVHAPAAL